jgi:hypothetical protein
MLGIHDAGYHFEFTFCRSHPVVPAPTPEDLCVFYVPSFSVWQCACTDMKQAGFKQLKSFNPYWDSRGRTYQDHDGYRIVLQNDKWINAASSQ